MLDSQDTIPDIRIAGSDEETGIYFSDLKPLIEQGLSRGSIRNHAPDLLNDKKVLRARSYFRAKVIPRPEKEAGVLHVLCDENISSRHVATCQRIFGYATSIAYEHMISSSDRDVWDYAVRKKFDLIITQDRRNIKPGIDSKTKTRLQSRDLTRIALERWEEIFFDPNVPVEIIEELPMILHLQDDARKGKKFGKIAAHHLSTIFYFHASKSAAVLNMHSRGVDVQTSAFSLLRKRLNDPIIMRRTRWQQWAYFFLNKLLPDRELWRDRDDPHVKRIKRKVTRTVAITKRNAAIFDREEAARKMRTAPLAPV